MSENKCNKCNKTLGEICTDEKQQKTFKELVGERARKVWNHITSVSQGTYRNEMDIYHECDGVVWHEP